MSNITDFVDKITDEAPYWQSPGYVYVMRNIIDFSETEGASADTVDVIPIKAGVKVLDVAARQITAEGATCTATVGDSTGGDIWITSLDMNSAAGTLTTSATETASLAAASGKIYSDDDKLILTLGHNTDTAVVEVVALCVDYFPDL